MVSPNFWRPIFSNYLHMIKRLTFCFSYLCLIKWYTFCVSIIFSTLFLQILSWNFMKNAQHMMCDAHWKGPMCTKASPNENWSSIALVERMISSQNLYRFPTLVIQYQKLYLANKCTDSNNCTPLVVKNIGRGKLVGIISQPPQPWIVATVSACWECKTEDCQYQS